MTDRSETEPGSRRGQANLAASASARAALTGALDDVGRDAAVPGGLVEPARHPAGIVALVLVAEARQPVGSRIRVRLGVAMRVRMAIGTDEDRLPHRRLLPCRDDLDLGDLQQRFLGSRPTAATFPSALGTDPF